MHDAPLRRKGRSVGTGRVLGGEDSAWRWGWVSGLHGVLKRSACGCTARHTCGVQGLKAVCGGPACGCGHIEFLVKKDYKQD